MLDLTLPDRIAQSRFTIASWAPGQSNVVAPYRPALLGAGTSATSWAGNVALFPAHQDGDGGDYHDSDREMLAFMGKLQGNRHRVKLTLPDHMRSEAPPATASATITAARLTDEGTVVTVSAANWGTWAPTPGSYINIGERLYLLTEVDGTSLTVLPRIKPVAIDKPRGLHVSPGGGGPVEVRAPGVVSGPFEIFVPSGLGTYRGSLYAAWKKVEDDKMALYWVDPHTGTRRQVLYATSDSNDLAATGSAFGNMYVFGGSSSGGAVVYQVHIDLADPTKNRLRRVLQFNTGTGVPTAITGMASWQGPTDAAPRLYITSSDRLYVSSKPLPSAEMTGQTFSEWFTVVTEAGTFSALAGLSPPPEPGGPLYILDQGIGRVYTWDGVATEEFIRHGGGRLDFEFATSPQLFRATALEWFNGQLYVGTLNVGTTVRPGLLQWNDTPADAVNVEFREPFVWARLSGGATAGFSGADFPETSFQWTEVVS